MAERPAGVPADAQWDSADEGWVQVPHPDEQGRKHGLVTCWRRDGSLAGRHEYRNGVIHGSYSRYHESGEVSRAGTYVRGKLHGVDTAYRSTAPTTEVAFDNSFADVIVRCETDIAHGRCSTLRCYDRDGNEVTLAGRPVPPRPAQVPAQAFLAPKDAWWFAGEWDAAKGAGHGSGCPGTGSPMAPCTGWSTFATISASRSLTVVPAIRAREARWSRRAGTTMTTPWRPA
jgi:hypothetical protein